MQYVLGNMLNGGGGLNADGLSLDLQFAADKTLTARRGPTPTFTRASSGTFVGSDGLVQTAATNIPRFDHTSAGVCRGLLIEESRTNLYSRSEEFETVPWTKTRSSITANATTAPDGTLTADKLVEDTTASNTHNLGSAITPPATAHTLSVFAKKGERTWIVLRLGAVNTFFDLDGGTIAAGSSNSPTITNFGNGWYRCTVTSSAGTQGSLLLATNSTTTFYTGDGTSGVFIWGAQLEAGSFATSYIPTVASSVVRSADVCSITGSAFTGFYNQSEGTALVKTIGGDATSSRELFRFETASAPFDNIFISGYNRFLSAEVSIVTNNTQQFVHFSSLTRGYERLSLAYAQNNAAYSRNGSIASTDNSVVTSSSINRLILGNNGINGCISSFSYYKKRLPNIKLNSLTAS